MLQTIRTFLLVEGVAYALAGSTHFGLLLKGHEHRQAAIAESLIAAVLLIGFALTFALASQARTIGLAAQGFALALTLVGAFTIAIGVGPRTVGDIVFHGTVIVALIVGLVAVARGPAIGPVTGV
jgi:hypothetical protein